MNGGVECLCIWGDVASTEIFSFEFVPPSLEWGYALVAGKHALDVTGLCFDYGVVEVR